MEIRLGLVSGYSFLYGVHNPGSILDRAASFGIKVVSFCDLNSLYGVHTVLEAAKERGIRPIIGAALTMSKEQGAINKGEKVIFCFVENRAGFGRLCELLTLRSNDKEKFNPLPLLCEESEGLVLASSDSSVLESLTGRVKRLYAAITPCDIRAVSTSRRLNIPLAFLDNSLLLEPEDFTVHRVLCAIRLLKTIGNLKPQDTAEPERVLFSKKELHRCLMSWPEAVKGTEEIAAICTFNELFDGWIFPAYETGKTPNGCQLSVYDELRKRVYEGMLYVMGSWQTGR